MKFIFLTTLSYLSQPELRKRPFVAIVGTMLAKLLHFDISATSPAGQNLYQFCLRRHYIQCIICRDLQWMAHCRTATLPKQGVMQHQAPSSRKYLGRYLVISMQRGVELLIVSWYRIVRKFVAQEVYRTTCMLVL